MIQKKEKVHNRAEAMIHNSMDTLYRYLINQTFKLFGRMKSIHNLL